MKNRKARVGVMILVGFVVGFGMALALGRWCFFRPDKIKTVASVQWIGNSTKFKTADTVSTGKAKRQFVQDTVKLEANDPTPQTSDTTHYEIKEEENWAEVEFAMDDNDENVVVLHNTLLSSRKVKVRLMPATDAADPVVEIPITQFELQQWSTPIKNRIEYLRTGHVIKLKGTDIAQVEIIYHEGRYLLLYAHKKYVIPANMTFEKLEEATVK
ncbi:MAG: hypothetical protein LBL18_00970 [Bacteroidales bacterium]|nr:hypothetical protein [Bacteroidales bacterium]